MNNGWKAILFLVFTVLLICIVITVNIPGEAMALILIICCTTGVTIHYSIKWFKEWSKDIVEYDDM